MKSVCAAIGKRPWLWLGTALGFVAAYHALLLGALAARFGRLPNYFHTYDLVDAYRLTLAGTPSLRDALGIAAAEPWFDIGYFSAQWNMSEWSLMILPPKLAVVALAGILVATFLVLALASRRANCTLAAGTGAGLVGVSSATLFWVVCCSTPTWAAGLAMLGLSVSLAFALEPAGPLMAAAGIALLAWSIVRQSWSLSTR
jgi:hypothetical protein